jgi:hypothetical protein
MTAPEICSINPLLFMSTGITRRLITPLELVAVSLTQGGCSDTQRLIPDAEDVPLNQMLAIISEMGLVIGRNEIIQRIETPKKPNDEKVHRDYNEL